MLQYPLLHVYIFSWLIRIVHICCYMFSHSVGLSACSNILCYMFTHLVSLSACSNILCYMFTHSAGLSACSISAATCLHIQLAYQHNPYPLLHVYTFRWLVCMLQYPLLQVYIFSWLIHIVHIRCYMFTHSAGLSA